MLRAILFLLSAMLGLGGLVLFVTSLFLAGLAWPRDLDGRYEKQDPQMHAWFDHLSSGKGLCCSFADGFSVQDVDWDDEDKVDETHSGYRVRVTKDWGDQYKDHLGEWASVPPDALIKDNNKFGPAVVWPYSNLGAIQIRCFMPGAGT